jgi:hypothetical protein
MDCITTFPTTANTTFPVILPRPKTTPTDLVDDVLARLRATTDPGREVELLSLGIDVLRRRQADRGRGLA